MSRRAVLLAVASVAASAHLLAAPTRLVSGWVDEAPTIDGVVSEWTALSTWEDAQLSIGVRNDARSLYIAIGAPDQARKLQLLTAGLIIWLDASGGKKRSFGIRVPGISLTSARSGTRTRATRPTTADLPDLTYFEIAGPKDDDRRRIERASTRAIQVARDQHGATLVLELQIPLASNDAAPYAIGTRPGQMIGLGLETPKIDRPEEPPPDARGRGGMGGGMGGRGGGPRGGGAGGRGGGRGGGARSRIERADSLKVWTTVQLATEKSPPPFR